MMTRRCSFGFVLSVLAFLAIQSTGLAATTYIGPGTDWNSAANWDNGVPAAGVEAVIGNTGSNRTITGASGQTGGFNFSQSSAAVNQITLGGDVDVASGTRTYSNTSGSASNLVLDLNGHDFRSFTTASMTGMTIQSSAPGGTFTHSDGQLNLSGTTIGPGVTVQGPTWAGWTLYDDGSGAWDPTSTVRGRSTEHATTGIVASGSATIGNLHLEAGSLNVNGGLAILGDVTMDVLSTTPYAPGAFGPYYTGVFNLTNNPNHGLRVGGNWYDPNPLGNYHQGNYEGDFQPLRLQFNGGGNVQTFYTAKSDVESRLQVDEDSHLELAGDFISTYPLITGGIESSLGNRSTLDVGTFDLDISGLTMYAATAADQPTIIYAAGTDSGSVHVDTLVHANQMAFVIEDEPFTLWGGGDFQLLTFNDWTGITDFSSGSADVTLPAGWTHDGVVVTDNSPSDGSWVLSNLQANGFDLVPEPTTLVLFCLGGLGLLLKRRRNSQ